MRTLRIEEARSTTQVLSDEQAAMLTRLGGVLVGERRWWGESSPDTSSGSVFRLTRLYGGSWRIEVGNVVGVVGLPGLTLIIEPKIGADHFQHLLARSNGLPRVDSASSYLATGVGLQRLVIEWFVSELNALFRRGVVRDYVDAADRLPYVRGHVNLASTSRQWLQGRAVADCEFEDFTEDTAHNCYLAAAIEYARRSPWIDESLRARLAYAARELPHPRPDPLLKIELDNLPPRYKGYRKPLKYAVDILSGVGRAFDSGIESSGTFLFNSAAVAEEGIRVVLAAGLHPMRVVKTGGRQLLPSFVSVNPDLEFGPPPFTGDVKYKVGDRSWNRQDLAQAVLFAAAYKSPQAFITDFVTPSTSHPTLVVGDIRVNRLRWAVGQGTEPEESERSFVENAKAMMSSAMAYAV